ncbi:MAG: hypothetical protein OEY18_12945 [Candidatus Aminicenantes bacterium]|nr:hypothetical protein [Candidatus Aminicenantes bacterium]
MSESGLESSACFIRLEHEAAEGLSRRRKSGIHPEIMQQAVCVQFVQTAGRLLKRVCGTSSTGEFQKDAVFPPRSFFDALTCIHPLAGAGNFFRIKSVFPDKGWFAFFTIVFEEE